jgi:hypothetical protein
MSKKYATHRRSPLQNDTSQGLNPRNAVPSFLTESDDPFQALLYTSAGYALAQSGIVAAILFIVLSLLARTAAYFLQQHLIAKGRNSE